MNALKDIEFQNPQGQTATLGQTGAKAVLIVNVASKCGLTPQYESLQKLYSKYHSRGLEILGFPANEFLGQEPGTDQEIQNFCTTEYNVTFPVNRKIVVKGEGQHPLYKALTEGRKEAIKNADGKFENLLKDKNLLTGQPHDIHWNFEKFLVTPDGHIVERYFPDITPDDARLTAKIEELLG